MTPSYLTLFRTTILGSLTALVMTGVLIRAQVPVTQPATDHFTVVPADSAFMQPSNWPVFPSEQVQLNRSPRTFQYLFDVPPDIAGPTRAIAFRRTNFPAHVPGTMRSFDVGVTLSMGHSSRTPSQIHYARALNVGPDLRQVTARRLVSFPAVPPRSDNRYAFTHRIPLDQPFQFNAGANGLIEMRVDYSSLPVSLTPPAVFDLFFDARFPEVFPSGTVYDWVRAIGFPCSPGGPWSFENRLEISAFATAGNSNRVFMDWHQGAAAPGPQDPTVFFGGMSDRAWGPFSLPMPLDSLGAPGCTLYASLEWTFPLRLSDFRVASVSSVDATLPADPSLFGATFFMQAVRLAPAHNALGLFTSNALQLRSVPYVLTTMAHTQHDALGSFGSDYVENFAFGGPVILLDAR